MNCFSDVLNNRGYDAAFCMDAVKRFWFEQTGDTEAV